MKKLLLAATLLTLVPLAAGAEDLLSILDSTGATKFMGGKQATGGGIHLGPIISDATDPRIGATVSATTGLLTSNLAIGGIGDAAGDGAGASLLATAKQISLDLKAGAGAPGATSASAAAMQGAIPAGSAQTSSPLPSGGIARTAVPTAVADGQAVTATFDKSGRQVVIPYTMMDQALRGTPATVVITVPTALLAASGSGSVSTFLTSMECGNSSATAVWATLSDSAATKIMVPAGGGNNPHFDPPLVSSAANTAISVVGDSTQTTVVCVAQGFKG